jgi:hypothetical protein
MTGEFTIEVGPLQYERGNLPLPEDWRLGIPGTLTVLVAGREWFKQPMFPVVELAAAVGRWLQRGGDLEFETMEAEESPFLWIRLVPEGCKVGAAWEVFPIARPLPLSSVRYALAEFMTEISKSTEEQLGIDISALIGEPANRPLQPTSGAQDQVE